MICEELERAKMIGKLNSKWGKLYKLDPWYKKLKDAHKESYCKICNPNAERVSEQ